jgi:hypothetical protein
MKEFKVPGPFGTGTGYKYQEVSTDIEDRNSVYSEYRASFELRDTVNIFRGQVAK